MAADPLSRRGEVHRLLAPGRRLRRRRAAHRLPPGRRSGLKGNSAAPDGFRRMRDECLRREGVRAALFDVDGTLVDTNRLHVAAWREAFHRFGHDVPAAEIGWQVGKGGDNLIPSLLPDLDEEERKRIEDFRSGLYTRDYLPRAVPFPGVRALFERLKADEIRIVLASSSHRDEVGFYLALIGCEDLV